MITLRPATAHDATQIADLYLASRRVFVSFAPIPHSDEDVRLWITTVLVPSGSVTVAVDGSSIVGMMAAARRDGVGWIDQLYLLPSHVGRGIGGRLLQHALDDLGPPVRLHTFQANAGARRFYERRGFEVVDYGDGTGNEERCPDVLMEWSAEVR
ncbi:MAG TPA: GNAT family N-acetyltransferase [Candidatus Binatia bacterium]|jgi:ribosomal protein S18 acetylase RimI-like enzyme|nr:GNAT family N-acetyltransferase [Candidatus Binatia bacterium]